MIRFVLGIISRDQTVGSRSEEECGKMGMDEVLEYEGRGRGRGHEVDWCAL